MNSFIDVRCVAVNIIVTYAGIGIHNYYLRTQYELISYIINQSMSALSEVGAHQPRIIVECCRDQNTYTRLVDVHSPAIRSIHSIIYKIMPQYLELINMLTSTCTILEADKIPIDDVSQYLFSYDNKG